MSIMHQKLYNAVLVVNYDISIAIMLEIAQFTTRKTIYTLILP